MISASRYCAIDDEAHQRLSSVGMTAVIENLLQYDKSRLLAVADDAKLGTISTYNVLGKRLP